MLAGQAKPGQAKPGQARTEAEPEAQKLAFDEQVCDAF